MAQHDEPDLGFLEDLYARLDPKNRERVEELGAFTVPDLTPGARDDDETAVREGWRAWEVSGEKPKAGEVPKLYSVAGTSGYFWKPRVESVAECNRHGKPCDAQGGPGIPGEGCHCGFYSAKDHDHLKSLNYHTYDGERDGRYCVIGRVANWGKVIEGSLGWRAQKSYPIELFIPFEIWEIANPLSRAYGVPVRLDNILKAPKPGVHY